MMRILVVIVAWLLCAAAGHAQVVDSGPGTVTAAAGPSARDDALRLQVELVLARDEVIRLKTVILNLQIGQLDQERARLTAERQQVEQRLREALQPPVDHVYDWQRQQFVPRPETPQ